jgi:rod shape-determining protein MreB
MKQEEEEEKKENIKKTIGFINNDESITIIGKDIVKGVPLEKEIFANDVYNASLSYINELIRTMSQVYSDMPEELANDLNKTGVYLVGGNSQIRGVKELLEDIMGVKITVNENSYACMKGAKDAWTLTSRKDFLNYTE